MGGVENEWADERHIIHNNTVIDVIQPQKCLLIFARLCT